MPIFNKHTTAFRTLTVGEIKMLLNNSTPTATISFAGLLLFLINPKKECEVAIVQCPKHELIIDIQEITIDRNGSLLKSRVISHSLSTERDIKITATQALQSGVKEHRGAEFNRENDVGDPNDSRWLVDIDGNKFGNQKLKLRPHEYVEKKKSLGPYINVTNGIIYTELISNEKFVSIALHDATLLPQFLGRVAFKVGLDIACEEGQGSVVTLSNADDPSNSQPLPWKENTRYLIKIENACLHSEESRGGTDFRFIFDAVSNSKNERFDIQRVVENVGCENSGQVVTAHSDFSLDSDVQVCMGGWLRQTPSFTESS
jgi:hypothetical protein